MVWRPFSVPRNCDHALRFVDAHAGHRLVEQQQTRRGGEHHRDFELALLAVRKVRGQHVGAVTEADFVQDRARRDLQRRVLARRTPEAKAVAGVRLHRQRDVVEHAELAVDAGDLERARKPLVRARGGAERGDVLPGEPDAPRIRAQVAGELCDQRRLAGAVRTDDGVRFTWSHVERHPVGGAQRTKRLDQSLDVEQRLSHGDRPRGSGPRGRAWRTARPGSGTARG